jgi:hypothetical protein
MAAARAAGTVIVSVFASYVLARIRGPSLAPVRRYVTAMTPDGTELMPADGLPDLPSRFEVGTRVQRLAIRTDHGLGQGRHHAMDLATDPQQDGEGGQHEADQEDPELAGSGHDVISTNDDAS